MYMIVFLRKQHLCVVSETFIIIITIIMLKRAEKNFSVLFFDELKV